MHINHLIRVSTTYIVEKNFANYGRMIDALQTVQISLSEIKTAFNLLMFRDKIFLNVTL